MTSYAPIGIFDSGFGGLTIFKQIQKHLSQYDYIYLGDNARSPYGHRSFETVYNFTREGVEYLFTQGCPLIIIACNTASAKALRNIQQLFLPCHYSDRRVLGVIRPTVEALHRFTTTNSVALWATQGTVLSESFALEIEKHAPQVKLFQQACPLLVPLVETGELSGPGIDYFISKYWDLTAKQSNDIDTLLLACTHYPLILESIQAKIPKSVRILTQDELVAPSLIDYLSRHRELGSRLSIGKSSRFLTTDSSEHFNHLAEIFMGHRISSTKIELR